MTPAFRKTRFILFAILLLAGRGVGKAQNLADYVCATNADNASVTITGYLGDGGNVSLPNTITGLLVTAIGAQAFQDSATLTNLTMPSNVTSIGDYAFEGCSALTNVIFPNTLATIGEGSFYYCGLPGIIIPDGVTRIGPVAFAGCALVGNVTIPSSVTNLGYAPFGDCTNLTGIAVETGSSYYSSVNGVLFNQSQTGLIEFPGGATGSYVIPAGVTGLSNFAFAYCSTHLTNISFADSVTNIGGQAFEQCLGLTRLTLPGHVTSLEEGAFASCSNLTNIFLPASLTNIGNYQFYECLSLASVYFGGNAPIEDLSTFDGPGLVTIYYAPGRTGWRSTFDRQPTVLWNPLIQTTAANFGLRGGRVSFNIVGTAGIPIVVEACSNLVNPAWNSLQSLTLTNGLVQFSEPAPPHSLNRFYRISSQ